MIRRLLDALLVGAANIGSWALHVPCQHPTDEHHHVWVNANTRDPRRPDWQPCSCGAVRP